MPVKSSNVPSSLVFAAIGAASVNVARGINNSDWFSAADKSVYLP